MSTKNVRVPVELERAFDALPNKQRWRLFPEFVREAVRYYLAEQERLAKFGVVASQVEDRTQAEPQPDRRSRHK